MSNKENLIRERDEIKAMMKKRRAVVVAAGDDPKTDRILDFQRWALDGVERALAEAEEAA